MGLPGWTALRQALDDLTLAQRSHVERVEIVKLRSATWGGDRIAAARILTRWPEISSDNLYTAVATGNLDEVERRLSADPAAAVRKGGRSTGNLSSISPTPGCLATSRMRSI